MHAGADDFLDEQTKGLAELAEHLRTSRLAAARKAAVQSAARIRSLNGRIRTLARSGVKLTSISHDAAQNLIELQGEIINSALTDAAAQIERIAALSGATIPADLQADLDRTRGDEAADKAVLTAPKSKSVVREYAEALIIAVLLALVIRTFVVQAFKIPSGSMLPTLQIGDHILVNKFLYGPRLEIPLTQISLGQLPGIRKPKAPGLPMFSFTIS